MLSVLSTGATLYDFDTHRNWKITRALYLSDGLHKVFPAGGNNIAGVLGQIGGALELAEQVMKIANQENATSECIICRFCHARKDY